MSSGTTDGYGRHYYADDDADSASDDDFDDDYWDESGDEESEQGSEMSDENEPINPRDYGASYKLNQLRDIPREIADLCNGLGRLFQTAEANEKDLGKQIDELKAENERLKKPFGERQQYQVIRIIEGNVPFTEIESDDQFMTRWSNYQQRIDEARQTARDNDGALAHNTRLFRQIIDLLKGIGYSTTTLKQVRRKSVLVETAWYAELLKVAPECAWTTEKLESHYKAQQARFEDFKQRRRQAKEAAAKAAEVQRQAVELVRLQNLLSEQTKRVDSMKILARSMGMDPDKLTPEELETRLQTELKRREAGSGLERAIHLDDHGPAGTVAGTTSVNGSGIPQKV